MKVPHRVPLIAARLKPHSRDAVNLCVMVVNGIVACNVERIEYENGDKRHKQLMQIQ